MNTVDLAIIAFIGVVTFIGLQSGAIRPASGTGGVLLGLYLAARHHAVLMPALSQYIGNEMLQRVAAFIAVVLIVAVGVRVLASLVKKLLSMVMLGWVDHVAGGLAAAAIAVALVGTGTYLMGGLNVAPMRQAMADSIIAPEISRLSLVSASKPWCSQLQDVVSKVSEGASQQAGIQVQAPPLEAACTDLRGFAFGALDRHLRDRVEGMLGGYSLGDLVTLVKASLTGSTEDVMAVVEANDAE